MTIYAIVAYRHFIALTLDNFWLKSLNPVPLPLLWSEYIHRYTIKVLVSRNKVHPCVPPIAVSVFA